MTKRQSAKRIIRNQGRCTAIWCKDCALLHVDCGITPEQGLIAAKKWLKDNPPKELPLWVYFIILLIIAAITATICNGGF